MTERSIFLDDRVYVYGQQLQYSNHQAQVLVTETMLREEHPKPKDKENKHTN